MQEQPQYRITPDQGWSSMKPVLDREMPLNRRSRRFIFFWWTVSAMAVIGISGLLLTKGNSMSRESFTPVAPISKPPIQKAAPSQNIQKNMASMDLPNQKPNAASLAASTSKTKKIKSANKLSPQPRYTSDQTNPANLTTNVALISSPAGPAVADEGKMGMGKKSVTVNGFEKTETTDQADGMAARILEEGENNSSNGQVVASLPALSLASLEETASMEPLQSPACVIKMQRTSPLFEPAIAVDGFAGQHGGIGGSADLGVAIKVTPRLSLTASIGYRSFRPDASIFGSQKDVALNAETNSILYHDQTYSGTNTYIRGEFVNSTASYNVLNPFVKAIRQWQFGGGVTYKITKKFSAAGGVYFGFNTKALSEYPIVLLDPSNAVPGTNFGKSLDRYNVIRSSMTSFYGEIGYALGNHFTLTANWIHGLNPYLLNQVDQMTADNAPSGKRTDYIRGLSLGVRYNL